MWGSSLFQSPEEYQLGADIDEIDVYKRQGGNRPAVFNAANERAVSLFLDRKIGFLEITDIIQEALESVPFQDSPGVEQILEAEAAAYELIGNRWR